MSGTSSPGAGPLDERQLATIAAVAEAIIPRGGAFPLGASDVDVAPRLNQYLTAFSPSTQRQIKLLVSAWEYSALLSRHLRPFSRLDAIERQRFVQEAAHSRYPWRRIPIMWLKHLCGFVYG